ncbi:MAG: molybdopterin-guanine dinucleotide biosynthesis protein B [Planctomycetes bacterium]|nr:molybdopterin-guanine dinucleotide biosynthesis protein B [Planctomycetota bacterium]
MRYIAFCGPSDSGKTWMIERLVRLWCGAGLKVGVLKHCSKGYQLDREGKDSARCWGAGAAVVGVIGPQEWAVRHREPSADPLKVIEQSFPRDLDVAILEGFREVVVPRVRVFGDSEPLDTLLDAGTIACVSRAQSSGSGAPFFALTDEEGLSDFLIRRLDLGGHFHPARSGAVLRHERASQPPAMGA